LSTYTAVGITQVKLEQKYQTFVPHRIVVLDKVNWFTQGSI